MLFPYIFFFFLCQQLYFLYVGAVIMTQNNVSYQGEVTDQVATLERSL